MAEKETSIGLEENLAGAAAYALGPISGIGLLLMEKKNKFVRFHAMQSTIVFGALFVLSIVVSMITSALYSSTYAAYSLFYSGGMMYMLTSGIRTLISIISFLLWAFLMYQAYQGKKYKLPVIGGIAAKQLK